MSANATTLERWVGRVPRSVRVGLWMAWSVPAAFVAWQLRTEHDFSPLLWIVVAPGALLMSVLEVIQLARAIEAPDREPFDLSRFSQIYIIVTTACLGLGVWSFLDRDPATKPYIGGPMFVVGLALVAMAIRHFAKPVRKGYLDLPQPERSSADQSPEVSVGWSQAARRSNEGRERRADVARMPDRSASDD